MSEIFPGFILILSAPRLIDSIARDGSKWMSATRGILICFLIFGIAFAEAISGIATRTISQPSFSSCLICFTVFCTSVVRVSHIDWIVIFLFIIG